MPFFVAHSQSQNFLCHDGTVDLASGFYICAPRVSVGLDAWLRLQV